jgi:hypothetical protein
MKIARTPFWAAIVLMTGCSKPEWPADLDRRIERSELIGEWKLDPLTAEKLQPRWGEANVLSNCSILFGADQKCVLNGIRLGEGISVTDEQSSPDLFAQAIKHGTWTLRYGASGIPNILELRFPIPGGARTFLPNFTEEGDQVELVLALSGIPHPIKFVRVSAPSQIDSARPADPPSQPASQPAASAPPPLPPLPPPQ